MIVSCTPAIAASWKHILEESSIFSSLRYKLDGSKTSSNPDFLRVDPGKEQEVKRKYSNPDDIELPAMPWDIEG